MQNTKKISKLKDDGKWAWFMLAPNIIGFFLFMLVPVVATFVLSFTKYDMLTTPQFIGLKNYIDMAKDPMHVLFSAAGVMLDQRSDSQILQGGVFPAVDYFHGCGRNVWQWRITVF